MIQFSPLMHASCLFRALHTLVNYFALGETTTTKSKRAIETNWKIVVATAAAHSLLWGPLSAASDSQHYRLYDRRSWGLARLDSVKCQSKLTTFEMKYDLTEIPNLFKFHDLFFARRHDSSSSYRARSRTSHLSRFTILLANTFSRARPGEGVRCFSFYHESAALRALFDLRRWSFKNYMK